MVEYTQRESENMEPSLYNYRGKLENETLAIIAIFNYLSLLYLFLSKKETFMLTYMRNRSQKWVKIIVFGIIIFVFVLWGGSSYWGSEANKIAKVDRHIITTTQYSKAYQDALKRYQNKYGEALTPDMIKQFKLKETVLEEMID